MAITQTEQAEAANDAHLSGDHRFNALDASMKRHRFAPDALIEVLHTAQELFGYLRPEVLYYVARGLKLPPSRVYGVATFYHLFSLEPKGKHTCVVCTGTACYVRGADALLEEISGEVGVAPGQTTSDGRITLTTARCLGSCGIALVVVYDGETAGHQDFQAAHARIEGWVNNGIG